ncbi:hypothetical protein Tco_0625716 [Tanacetum coccineum]|uniref:Uncharacterized protein n=1 Tax=Tanacetum coccineum TaxID=301880 RepID=A0ABQ4WHL0_9ASTR
MTLDIHNWSSSAHQDIHKIVKDEMFPIVNQVDARVQNFEIQFLKEAAKFVRDFQSLAKEADESLVKHKALELEIERLLRAVVSQDIMSIVQNNSVRNTSNLQTELERMKERFENCIIKKENEYAKLWNDWYKKCEECKYDKISYDKAYNDMQQKIERLQAQLGDQKGKCKDNPCVSDTLDPLSQKLENENVSEQKDTNKGTSVNTQFCKQSIVGKPPSSGSKLYAVTPFPKSKGLPKIDETHALSKSVTSNSVPTPQESKVMKNDNVIAPGMFRINYFKPSRNDKSEVVCSMCKQCLITANHYVNDMNSRGKKQKANVSNTENQKKQKPKVVTNWKTFHLKGKIIASSESESQSDCSNDDNACISNPQEPTRNVSQMLHFIGMSISNLFMVCRLGCSRAHDSNPLSLPHKFLSVKFLGTVRFGNDHVAANPVFMRSSMGKDIMILPGFI